MIKRFFRASVYNLHYLWLIVGISAFMSLLRVVRQADQSRTSIVANRKILESLETVSGLESFALVGMLISLFVLRRRLKRGVIRRLGI